jgi:hypothetical protein
MTLHEDNAVAHYDHLCEQGVPMDRAIQHVIRRFGVSEADFRRRLGGRVAQHQATMEALAAARELLVTEDDDTAPVWEKPTRLKTLAALRALYAAVTGEGPSPDPLACNDREDR